MDRNAHRIEPFPRGRRLVTDVGHLARNKPVIRGLLEFDVTRPRRIIRAHKEQTGETLSFTAYLVACAGKAIDSNKYLHAYRNWTGKLVLYDEVDIATMIEVERDGKRFPVGHIIRGANRKSFRQIHEEIREVQATPVERQEAGQLMALSAFPGILRRLLFRVMELSPRLIKQYRGTVVLTAVGMFGQGGGWGLSLPTHTLGITIGGIDSKPGVIDGKIEVRECLSVTLDFDHDIVDGAPAARFAQRYRELVESGTVLG
jgi:pyruvate/2-oxoglutarate dehydrogenase complex dihydrolipoamide acyltransferase (E2) component